MNAISTGRAWFSRLLAAFVLATFLPAATTACFGKFQLIRKVYNFNKQVSPDKWIQWFVFLILIFPFFPIYGLASLIDAVIANSIEFWTGKNPIVDAGTKRFAYGPSGETLRMTLQRDGRIEVLLSRPGASDQRFFLTREAGSVAAHDAEGNLLSRVGDRGGAAALLEGALPSR
jgi:hypothetical protein